MSSEIEEFDEQMIELIHGIKHVLEREIPSLKGVERTDRCAYLRNRLARAKQVHRTILVEIRELPKDQTGDWDAKAKQYETEIGQLLQDVEWAETTAKSNDPGGVKKPTIDEMTTKEVTKQAMMVQNETKGATERILRNIDQTTALAVDVNTELVRQGEQLHNVKEGLDSVESNLKRADKQLRTYVNR